VARGDEAGILDLFEHVERERVFILRIPDSLHRLVRVRACAKLEADAVLLLVEIARRRHPHLARGRIAQREEPRALFARLVFADQLALAGEGHGALTYSVQLLCIVQSLGRRPTRLGV